MKNLMSTIIFISFFFVLSYAQTEEGTILLGTSSTLIGTNFSLVPDAANNVGISFGSSKFKSDDFESESEGVTAFNIAPKVGYFIVDDGLLGFDLSFNFLKSENDDDPVTGISFSPFFRYYLPTENFRPFVQAQGGLGLISVGSGDENKTNILNYGAGVGGAFFIGEKVSIDLMAGFNHQEARDKASSNNARSIANLFGLAAGLSVFL
jgi:hypothetical protein